MSNMDRCLNCEHHYTMSLAEMYCAQDWGGSEIVPMCDLGNEPLEYIDSLGFDFNDCKDYKERE